MRPAPTLPVLVACRVLQGLGGALVLANVMAEITAIFPREERRRAMAVNASVLAMGQVTGLVLGGFLIDRLGWRSIFLVILVIGGLGLLLDLAVLRNRHTTGPSAPMDWWGGVLSVLVVGAPFLLIEGLSRLTGPVTLAVLLGGLILLGLFVAVERRSAWPLLDLRLLRSRAFTCGSIAAAFYFIVATFGYFLLPLYAQVVLGLSPFFAGLLIVPLSVALTVSSQLVGQMAGRFSARIVSTAGLICTSIGVLGMSLLGPMPSYPYMVGVLILAGARGGLFHPPNNSSVLGAVPPQDLAAPTDSSRRPATSAGHRGAAASILGQVARRPRSWRRLAWARARWRSFLEEEQIEARVAVSRVVVQCGAPSRWHGRRTCSAASRSGAYSFRRNSPSPCGGPRQWEGGNDLLGPGRIAGQASDAELILPQRRERWKSRDHCP